MATITSKQLEAMMQSHVRAETGMSLEDASPRDYWTALAKSIVEIISNNWIETRKTYNQGRQAHYFSAEFLEGRSMLNNLVNLGIYDQAKEALASFGLDLTDILEEETDPALGNGGLGRLAACFLDSCATLNLPVTGYGILYRYGLFRQAIENGFQKEYPDSWMERGYPFTLARYDEKVKVHYNDIDVWAIPFDLPITGYGTKSPKMPHHRPSTSDNVEEPIPGMLVGGPQPGGEDVGSAAEWKCADYR